MRYFKPKTTLQVVPENSDLMLSKDRTTNVSIKTETKKLISNNLINNIISS